MVANGCEGFENREDFPGKLVFIVCPSFDQVGNNGLAHVHGQGADEHFFLTLGALLDHHFVLVLEYKILRAILALQENFLT